MRVLIVEDHTDTAESFALMLGLQGVEVRVASNGPSALREAQDFSPRVVVLDLGLPGGMDGWEVARRLKALDKPPFICAVSGFAREEDRRKSDAAGIPLHLAKPVEPALIISLLERLRGDR
jgi:CheY-like chemotaxis protein